MGADDSSSRLAPARARARAARQALAAGGVVAFVAALVLARVTHPGHAKGPATALAAPGRFVEIVRHDQLEAGIIAPVEADPEAASAPS